jgi:hypothetical protein
VDQVKEGFESDKSALLARGMNCNTSEQLTNVGLDNVSIGPSMMTHLLISFTTRAGKKESTWANRSRASGDTIQNRKRDSRHHPHKG